MSHFTWTRGQLQPTLDQRGLPLTLQLHVRIMSRFMPKCNLMTVGHIFRTGQRCLQAKWESKDRTLPETNSTGNATTQNFLMWLEVMVITNFLMFNKFRLKVLSLQLSKTIRVHSSSLCFQDFFFSYPATSPSDFISRDNQDTNPKNLEPFSSSPLFILPNNTLITALSVQLEAKSTWGLGESLHSYDLNTSVKTGIMSESLVLQLCTWTEEMLIYCLLMWKCPCSILFKSFDWLLSRRKGDSHVCALQTESRCQSKG